MMIIILVIFTHILAVSRVQQTRGINEFFVCVFQLLLTEIIQRENRAVISSWLVWMVQTPSRLAGWCFVFDTRPGQT